MITACSDGSFRGKFTDEFGTMDLSAPTIPLLLGFRDWCVEHRKEIAPMFAAALAEAVEEIRDRANGKWRFEEIVA